VVESGGVGFGALALKKDGAVPAQIVGLKALKNGGVGAGHLPRWIDVFDAKVPGTAGRPGVEPARDGGAEGP
jgi:hypothetical protein